MDFVNQHTAQRERGYGVYLTQKPRERLVKSERDPSTARFCNQPRLYNLSVVQNGNSLPSFFSRAAA